MPLILMIVAFLGIRSKYVHLRVSQGEDLKPSPPVGSRVQFALNSTMVLFRCLPVVIVSLLWLPWTISIGEEDPAVHLTLHRRGDRFATHDAANLTRLTEVLSQVELRYALAERIIEGNRLGHQWKSRNVGTTVDNDLITAVGHDGRWQCSALLSPKICD